MLLNFPGGEAITSFVFLIPSTAKFGLLIPHSCNVTSDCAGSQCFKIFNCFYVAKKRSMFPRKIKCAHQFFHNAMPKPYLPTTLTRGFSLLCSNFTLRSSLMAFTKRSFMVRRSLTPTSNRVLFHWPPKPLITSQRKTFIHGTPSFLGTQSTGFFMMFYGFFVK